MLSVMVVGFLALACSPCSKREVVTGTFTEAERQELGGDTGLAGCFTLCESLPHERENLMSCDDEVLDDGSIEVECEFADGCMG